jgi:hypothetical protein
LSDLGFFSSSSDSSDSSDSSGSSRVILIAAAGNDTVCSELLSSLGAGVSSFGSSTLGSSGFSAHLKTASQTLQSSNI